MSDALLLRAMLERSSIRPGKAHELHLLVDVEAIGAPVDSARPSLSVVFVLDASSSMNGAAIDNVIASVAMLTDLLSPSDKVGVVVFANEAAEVTALAALDDAHKRIVKRRTAAVRANGGTNIEAGLVKAKSMLGARTAHERQVILLLSDGAPNVGAASSEALAAVVEPMRADASISTLGYGSNHNSDILHQLSLAGGGQYWFVPDPQEASLEFARALGAQGDIVVDNLELVLAPEDACTIKDVIGQKVRFGKSGPVLALPDLREKQKRLVVASLSVQAPTEPGRLPVLTARVRYRAAGSADVRFAEVLAQIDVVDREEQIVLEVHHAALMSQSEVVRSDARAAADKSHFEQAAAMLRAMIKALEKAPGYTAADGSPLSECLEQLVDEAVEYEQRPSAERYAAFKASQLGVEVSQGAKHAAAWGSSSQKSKAIMDGATGPVLDGVVIVRDARGNEVQRVRIASELTIGRTAGNDIVVASGALSKRHTRLVCRDGKMIVVDLKSTNGTFVDGKRVSSPQVLAPGAKIAIGPMIFEIELDPPKP